MLRHHDIEANIRQWVQSSISEQPILLISHSSQQREELCRIAKRSAVCETHSACGTCNACKQADANGHPDALSITEEKGRIRIKDIASLRNILSSSSNKRVVCIPHAGQLLPEAANALLKTLEEPAIHTRFLLGAGGKRSVLPTIRSRCTIIALHPILQETPDFSSEQMLAKLSDLRPPEPFQEEELLDISRLVHQMTRERGASVALFKVSLRLRDYYKTASVPGGNTKLAADILLASLANLRNTVK